MVTYLRAKEIRVIVYVDDFIVLGAKLEISSHTELLLSTLAELGWTVNFERSLVEPSQVKPFIGYIIDNTDKQTVIRIAKDRIRKLKKDIVEPYVIKYAHLELWRVLRDSVFRCVSVFSPAKLLLRNLHRQLASKESWDQKFTLDPFTCNDLECFFNSISQWNAKHVVRKDIDVQLVTNASHYAWSMDSWKGGARLLEHKTLNEKFK